MAPLTRRKRDLAPRTNHQPNFAAVTKWWSLSDRHHKKLFPEPRPAEIVPHALYLSPEHRTLVHNGGLVGLETINLLASGVQIGSMPFQTPAVSVPSFLEHLRHGLLVDDQIGHHLLYAAHPLLELLILLDHSLLLEGQIISLDEKVKGQDPPTLVFSSSSMVHILSTRTAEYLDALVAASMGTS